MSFENLSGTVRTERLRALIAGGLTLGECIAAFSVSNDDPYVQEARRLTADDNDIEIDDTTTTSVGDDGAWVLSWLWVNDDEAGVDRDCSLGCEATEGIAVRQQNEISENDLTELMLQRIENGDLDLGDIPNRLVQYGLMCPEDFIVEMLERIEMARDGNTSLSGV